MWDSASELPKAESKLRFAVSMRNARALVGSGVSSAAEPRLLADIVLVVHGKNKLILTNHQHRMQGKTWDGPQSAEPSS